jgi:murein DD-endopeptidase MepM/ murein hydrolase activator NlpD
MSKALPAAALAALTFLGFASAGRADEARVVEARVNEAAADEERLLGRADGGDELRDLLPFTREIGVGGTVEGSLEVSTAAAGVPASAMLEALQALETALDLDSDVRNGDRFYVRYEQAFTAAGTPIGVGRVLWAELRTAAKGIVAIHRYRSRDKVERFWLANGQAATPPAIRLPVKVVSISSGFGLRADPFDKPAPPPTAGKSGAMGGPLRAPSKLPPGLKPGTAAGASPVSPGAGASAFINPSAGQSAYGSLNSNLGRSLGDAVSSLPNGGAWRHAPPARRTLFMHEGIDLVAPTGTPVYAAADGVVVGAAPNGRYGNWIRIDHANKLATVYGHLSGFAPGIAPGTVVSRGELIGFVGNTGRSTASHLHFELLVGGKPVNPVTHPEIKRAHMRSPEIERFRKQVAQDLAERARETAVAASYER